MTKTLAAAIALAAILAGTAHARSALPASAAETFIAQAGDTLSDDGVVPGATATEGIAPLGGEVPADPDSRPPAPGNAEAIEPETVDPGELVPAEGANGPGKSNFVLAILLAIISSINLNVGKGIQKWKVKVFGAEGGIRHPDNKRDFRIWLIGFALTASASITYSLALKFSDKSSLVSSLNGVGMIGLVLFAWVVLREKIGRQEIGGAILVLIGATVMGYFDEVPETGQQFDLGNFIISALALAAIAFPPTYWSWKTRRAHGFTFGAAAGITLGVCLILGDMALARAGNDFLGQLRYGYPYAAILLGFLALFYTQLAFWRSNAMVVVPTINSFMILSPVVMEYFTFGTVLKPLQYGAVAVIVVGVVLLTYTEKQEKLDKLGEKEAEDEAPEDPAKE